jgi:hypothetical protein
MNNTQPRRNTVSAYATARNHDLQVGAEDTIALRSFRMARNIGMIVHQLEGHNERFATDHYLPLYKSLQARHANAVVPLAIGGHW